jgi:putative membrane protein
MKKRIAFVALLGICTGVVGARAEDKDQPFDDARFVQMASVDGMAEVQLGQIGSTQAKNDDVKKFAVRMAKDHAGINDNLKAAAKAADLPVPANLDEKHKATVARFKDYKGTNFDADYMKEMVAAHTDAVALFTRASKEAKTKAIKDFATTTLPTLQAHLESAQTISKSLK